MGDEALPPGSAHLEAGEGLDLLSPAEQDLPGLGPGESVAIVWRIRPAEADRTRLTSYSILASTPGRPPVAADDVLVVRPR